MGERTEERAKSLAPLAPTVLCVLALVAGVGRVAPSLVEALGALALAGQVWFARERIARAPRLLAWHVVLGAFVFLALALALATGGHGARISPDQEAISRRISAALAFLVAVALAAPFLWPRLMAPIAPAEPRQETPPSATRAGLAVVALAWALFHGAIFFWFPPFIWCDSWVNLWEPHLFQQSEKPYLHTPLYAELVRTLGEGPHFVAGLTFLVALQHVLVLVIALVLERLVRRETRSRVAAVFAALVVVIDGYFALHAQLVATEVVATAFVTGAVALLAESTWRPEAQRWLLGAGVFVALATLTRPALQAFVVVGIAWLLLAPIRPRWRSVAIFCVGALVPVTALKVHNYVFQGNARLTGQTGKALMYRIVAGMPPLTDPAASPDDPLERARRITWEKRDEIWVGPWVAIQEQLGWSDAEVEQVMQRFYFEQIRRHPAEFVSSTFLFAGYIAVGHETFESIVQRHNKERKEAAFGWDAMPPSPDVPPAIEAVSSLKLTARIPFLVLAALAPLLASGSRRRVALLALGAVLYAVFLPALVVGAIPRTRLPGMPFIAVAAAISLAALVALARRREKP